MKKLFFVLLLLSVIVVSGCLETDSEKTAIDLSNSTVEGNLANTLMQSLKNTDKCTVEDFKNIANLANPLIESIGLDVSLPIEENKASELVENAIKCNVQLSRNVLEIEKSKKYQVNYTVKADDSCKFAELKNAASSYALTIDVDLETKNAVVSKGKLKDKVSLQAKNFQPAFGIIGNCTAPVLLGVGLFGDFLGAGNENANASDDSIEEPSNDSIEELPVNIVSNFTAQWDAADAQKPLKFNWNYSGDSEKYYVALDMWNTGNSSPLGSIQSTIQNLKNGSPFPPSHVYDAENESGTLYWGGQYTYPDVFKIHAYLLNESYDLVGEIDYVQITRNNAEENPTSIPISINAPEIETTPNTTDIVSNFTAQWDAADSQKPLKFNWDYVPQDGAYFIALDMWNTGNSSPLGSIQSTIQNLKNGSPFPPSHVYDAEEESGTLYWGGQYTYPDIFKIHAYLLNESYDLVGEIAYVQITRNNASESPISVPIYSLPT